MSGVILKRVKTIFLNLLVLTATSLLLRTVGISFQVYISKKLGAEGMGLFQLLSSVYSLAITFSVSGVRYATVRLVSEELGTGKPGGALKAVRNSLVYASLFSVASMIILSLSAGFIGTRLLGDTRSILSLRLLSFTLPFISLSAVLNGYFIASRRASYTAGVSTFEYLVKISTTVFFIGILLPKGLEYACAAVVLGSCVGEVFSFLAVLLIYRVSLPAGGSEVGENLVARLLHTAMPVALSAYITATIGTITQLLVPRGLKMSGESASSALSTYGVIRGMTMPILMFPSVLLDAVSDLIVPELSECKANNSPRRLNYIVSRTFNLGILLSVCVMWIFLRYSDELGMTIYKSKDAAYFIRMLAPLIPVMYLDDIVDNMLKGIGEQVSLMRVNILTSIISAVLIYSLLPKYAITGYIVTIYVVRILNFTLSLRKLLAATELKIDLFRIAKSMFSIIGAVNVSDVLIRYFDASGIPIAGSLYFQIPLTALIYLLLLRVFSCITHDDVVWVKSILK